MALLTWGGVPLTWGDALLTWGPYTPPPSPGELPDAELPAAVEWVWSVGPGASSPTPGPTIDLVSAYGRVVTWRSRGHAFAQFTIDARSDEAAEIIPLVSDVWVYRDSVHVFLGRVLTVAPSLTENTHLWSVLAVDYRGMLTAAAAVEPPIPTYSGVDQGAIVWDLIDRWQELDGGNWGITDGAGAVSGTVRDETDITPGSPVGEVIDRLADRDGGFEWEVTPALVLNRYYPQRTRTTDVVLEFGGNVIAVEGAPAGFASSIVGSGSEETEPVLAEPAAIDERGRWTRSESFPSVKRQDTLAAKATFARDLAARASSTWSVTLAPGAWEGPGQLGVGDIVRLEVVDGGLSISGDHRVTDLQAVCGDRGTETVRVELEPWP